MKTLLVVAVLLASTASASAQFANTIYEDKELAFTVTSDSLWAEAPAEIASKLAPVTEGQRAVVLHRTSASPVLSRVVIRTEPLSANALVLYDFETKFLEALRKRNPKLQPTKAEWQIIYTGISFESEWFQGEGFATAMAATRRRGHLVQVTVIAPTLADVEAIVRELRFVFVPDRGNLPGANGNEGTDRSMLVRISQPTSQKLIKTKVQPKYPADARTMGVQGSVVMSAIITTQGEIAALWVKSGHPLLIDSALDAVHLWKYKPYVLNGEPVNVETQITVNYTLSR